MTSTDKNKSDFPQRLKQLRISKNLSQSELGEFVGVHYSHIGKYERGSSKPALAKIQLLADCLDVSTDYLLNGLHEDAAVANLEDEELLKMFVETEKLPIEDKELVKKFLDAFLTKRRLQKELAS